MADLVIEEVTTGFCGAVVRVEKTPLGFTVTLEDRFRKLRVFPLGPGFLIDGQPVVLVRPKPKSAQTGPARTASGSRAVAGQRARVAREGRIYVEGKHDAELVERVWGDDLRIEGVVVELLDGVDYLPGIVEEFGPGAGRRLGVLVDHMVAGSKETRIATDVQRGREDSVLVLGHPFVDIWQAFPGLVFVLFASALIDYDYIMALIARFTGQDSKTQKMSRDQLIGLIESDAKFMDEREAITDYPIFAGHTRFDIGSARVMALDLQDVALDERADEAVRDEGEDVLDGCVLRMRKAYPAYFGTYDRLSVVQDWAAGFANLFLVGRNGMHRYNNQDHSMLTAMMAVDNIIEGRTDQRNLWEVNLEEVYHEEKSS